MEPLKVLEKIRSGGLFPRYLFCAAGVLIAGAGILASRFIISEKEEMVRAKKAEAASFYRAFNMYREVLNEVSPLREKAAAYSPGLNISPGGVMEEVCVEAGTGKNITSIKPAEGKKSPFISESGVVVSLEGVSLNQILNIIYRIERHKNLLLVREFSMKSRSDAPGLFDISMEVAMVSVTGG